MWKTKHATLLFVLLITLESINSKAFKNKKTISKVDDRQAIKNNFGSLRPDEEIFYRSSHRDFAPGKIIADEDVIRPDAGTNVKSLCSFFYLRF